MSFFESQAKKKNAISQSVVTKILFTITSYLRRLSNALLSQGNILENSQHPSTEKVARAIFPIKLPNCIAMLPLKGSLGKACP